MAEKALDRRGLGQTTPIRNGQWAMAKIENGKSKHGE
jgi:hypothetical protein